MKWLTVITILLSANSVFAGATELKEKFASSELLKDTIQQIERQHRVTCTGPSSISVFQPKLFKKIKYVTACEGYKLKVSATFRNMNNPEFKLSRVKVWAGKPKSEQIESENSLVSSDPFLEAYKKSALVRDLRHFVEDNNKVVCDKGRAYRGKLNGKANYFYLVSCRSDEKIVQLKIKSKVKLQDDNYFRFDLVKYKLTF